MNFKYIFTFLAAFVISISTYAQVTLLSVSQLENRISQGKDTIYDIGTVGNDHTAKIRPKISVYACHR